MCEIPLGPNHPPRENSIQMYINNDYYVHDKLQAMCEIPLGPNHPPREKYYPNVNN